MKVLSLIFCLIAVSLAQFSFYPPSVTAFTATVSVTLTQTGQVPVTVTGTEKYLFGATINDFITETGTVNGQTFTVTEWVTLDNANLNEWDIESNAPNTCNHNTVPVAQLPTCTPWTSPVAGQFVMDCKSNNNGQAEVDHFILTANGNAVNRLNVAITVNNALVQTNAVVYTVTGTPTPADFTRPATCAPAAKSFRFRRGY